MNFSILIFVIFSARLILCDSEAEDGDKETDNNNRKPEMKKSF